LSLLRISSQSGENRLDAFDVGVEDSRLSWSAIVFWLPGR
jgi:hypothetical protein